MSLQRSNKPYSRRNLSPSSLDNTGTYIRVALIAVGGLAALGLAFFLFVYISYALDSGRITKSIGEYRQWLHGKGPQPEKPPIRIYARDGRTLIGQYLPERGSRISLKQCGNLKWLKLAAVSAEDRAFFDHGGVSYRGILRAMLSNLAHFRFHQGGGSITQQLARNLFTDRRATLYRKLYETFVAFKLEDTLQKDEILCLYLNKIYMGEGRIGAEEASWFYFRKPPWELDVAEAAMIVGLFPSPVRYSPLNDIERSLKKQQAVLAAMIDQEHIKKEEKDKALEAFYKEYNVSVEKDAMDPGRIGLYGADRDFRVNDAPSANEYVRSFLYSNFEEKLVRAGGLSVVTTIDPVRQRSALRAVRGRVEAVRRQLLKNEKVPADKMERIARRLNGVLVSLDARTGNILAVVGGYEVAEGNMTSRVWSMQRQPGSALKGFLYALAIDEEVLEPGQEVNDTKIDIDGYSPPNWYRGYKGVMPLRSAVAMSTNTVAVETLYRLGVNRFRSRLSDTLQLGYLESRQRFQGSYSLALGTGEMSPLELARVYAMILNDGRTVVPRLILKVSTPDRRLIWEDEEFPEGDLVLSPRAAAAALYLLSGVTEDPEGTMAWVGKRQRANARFLPFPVAGKSGTVQGLAIHRKKFPHMYGVHDAWYVGLVPGEATAVWVGHDEGALFPGSGSGTAGRIWSDYAQGALPGRVSGEFPAIEIQPIELPDESPANDLLENYQDSTPVVGKPEEGQAAQKPEHEPAPEKESLPQNEKQPEKEPAPQPPAGENPAGETRPAPGSRAEPAREDQAQRERPGSAAAPPPSEEISRPPRLPATATP